MDSAIYIDTSFGNKKSKLSIAHELKRLHNYPGTEAELLEELPKPCKDNALPTLPFPPYSGAPIPELDAPFTLTEVEAVARNLSKNSTLERAKFRLSSSAIWTLKCLKPF